MLCDLTENSMIPESYSVILESYGIISENDVVFS